MTETAHALVAGAIAAKFPNPLISVPLAFTSHFIMDAVPHWDIGTNWRTRAKNATGALAILETLIGITVTYFIFGGKVAPLTLFLTVGASLSPDWLETPWYIFFASHKKHEPGNGAGFWEKLAFKTYKAENFFHHKTQSMFLGLSTQVIVVAFFLALLKR